MLLPAAALPAAQTGVRSRRLGAQDPVAPWGAIARHSGLSSLPARSLGTNTTGVTPCEDAIALVTGENGERCTRQDRERNLSSLGLKWRQKALFRSSLCSYFASRSRCSVTQVLSLAVDPDVVYAAVKGLGGTVRPGTQT